MRERSKILEIKKRGEFLVSSDESESRDGNFRNLGRNLSEVIQL